MAVKVLCYSFTSTSTSCFTPPRTLAATNLLHRVRAQGAFEEGLAILDNVGRRLRF